MRIRLRRTAGAAVLAIVLLLACGVAVAAAQSPTQPSLVGSIQNPSSGTFAGSLSGPDAVAALNTTQGWFAYAPAYYSNDLVAINMSNPVSPAITNATLPDANEMYASDTVDIYGGIAYVVSKNQNGPCPAAPNLSGCSDDNGDGNSLSLFNVAANPSAPQFLGAITNATSLFGAYGIAVTTIGSEPYALVAAQGCLKGQPGGASGQACLNTSTAQGDALNVINVNASASPVLKGTVHDTPAGPGVQFPDDLWHPTAVAVSGNYAFVTSFYGDALTVVNIADPNNPQVVAELHDSTDFPAPSDVAIQGNYAYVANQNANSSGQGTFTVVDISNPTNPQVVGTVNATGLNGGYRVRVSGDLAYVAASGVASITAVDITNPAAPYVLTSLISSGSLFKTTGLDLMDMGGSEYVVASSPFLFSENSTANSPYPGPNGYPNSGPGSPTATGTISAIQLDPTPDAAILAIHSEPATNGQPYTTSTSANFIFATGDAVSAVACSLDGAPFGPCTSEATADYSNLAAGQHTFKMQATDAAGNTSVASYSWTIEAAPVNTAPPTVVGSTLAGDTVTANVGGWTGNSLAFAYQWQRCDAQGANCTVLHTSTQTYPIGPPDVGHTLRVNVTASNSVGTQSVTSAASALVRVCPSSGASPAYCALPKRKTRPTVTGTTEVGQTLVASPGSWSKLPASTYGSAQGPTFTVRWMRCNARGAHCVAIRRATKKTYRVSRRDLGARLRLQVVALNRNGSTIATSAPSAPIVKARTRVHLSLNTPAMQPSVRRGFVVAAIRSSVGALVDVTVGVGVGQTGYHWTSGTPVEVLKPGAPLTFRVVLSSAERRRLRRALAAHRKLTALVTVSSPGHPGIRPPKPQTVVITG